MALTILNFAPRKTNRQFIEARRVLDLRQRRAEIESAKARADELEAGLLREWLDGSDFESSCAAVVREIAEGKITYRIV